MQRNGRACIWDARTNTGDKEESSVAMTVEQYNLKVWVGDLGTH